MRPKVPKVSPLSSPTLTSPGRGQVPAPSEAAKMVDHVIHGLEGTHRHYVGLLQDLFAPLPTKVMWSTRSLTCLQPTGISASGMLS